MLPILHRIQRNNQQELANIAFRGPVVDDGVNQANRRQ